MSSEALSVFLVLFTIQAVCLRFLSYSVGQLTSSPDPPVRVRPTDRPSMLQIMLWIHHARDHDSPEAIFLWCRDFFGEAPPLKFPYAIR